MGEKAIAWHISMALPTVLSRGVAVGYRLNTQKVFEPGRLILFSVRSAGD